MSSSAVAAASAAPEAAAAGMAHEGTAGAFTGVLRATALLGPRVLAVKSLI